MSKHRAYSYLRFSTPEQMKGDSFRRQTTLAREYAQQNGLDLDETLTFQDLGVSAYQGRNVETGHLGEFLQAVKSGVVPRGSYLLVESLDRISRRSAGRAFRVLQDICDEDVIVVTLADRREYTRESLENDPTSLLMSILIFMRANEESATKARRLQAVWSAKRAAAGQKPLTAACPAWLTLDRESGKFALVPERAKLIRRIFRSALKGVGQHAIARELNEEGLKPFEGKYWHRSYVAKVLANPAAIGTYIPHRYEYKEGKRARVALDPIKDYYPAVVEREAFQRVAAMRESNNPSRGRHASGELRNLLGGLAKCPKCDDTMQMVNKGAGWVYLVCSSARNGKGCKYVAVRYPDIERAILKRHAEIAKRCPSGKSEGAKLEKQQTNVDAAISEIGDQIKHLLSAVETTGKRPAAALTRIAELEGELEELREKDKAIRAKLDALSPLAVQRKLEGFTEAVQRDPLDRREVNAILRQLFTGVTVDHEAGTLDFEWHHGGTTEVQYASLT